MLSREGLFIRLHFSMCSVNRSAGTRFGRIAAIQSQQDNNNNNNNNSDVNPASQIANESFDYSDLLGHKSRPFRHVWPQYSFVKCNWVKRNLFFLSRRCCKKVPEEEARQNRGAERKKSKAAERERTTEKRRKRTRSEIGRMERWICPN